MNLDLRLRPASCRTSLWPWLLQVLVGLAILSHVTEGRCSCGLYKDVSPEPTVFESPVLPVDECCRASVANGYLATVAYSDTVYMNGVYNGRLGDSHRARIPSSAAIRIALTSDIALENESYKLDVQQGTFFHILETPDAIVEHKLYAHQILTRLIVNEVVVTRRRSSNASVTIELTNNRGNKSDDINLTVVPPPVSQSLWYAYGSTLISETKASSTTPIFSYWADIPSHITLTSSETSRSWTFITSISDNKRDALDMYSIGQELAYRGTLFGRHSDAWKQKWASGRIDVSGNLRLAKAVSGSMYYILSSLPPLEAQKTFPYQFYGLSPGSLANGGGHKDYMGHVFWDQETWMYPPILMFHPELALEMLKTRTMHLDTARENAASYGNKGARFPWEAAYTGAEVCPADPYGRDEIHINGDIAFAVQQYLYATEDTDFLIKHGGFDMVKGLAEFWASRVQYNDTLKAYTIYDVMPPDEFHDLVNSSVYTNTVAQIALRLPAYAASLINQTVPSNWSEIAEQMYILYDAEKDYHPEFDGYQIGSQVKQADAILLGFPLMPSMRASTRLNDLTIYQGATDPDGPAMTWGMFAVGWLELGNQTRAAELFNKSFANIQEPFKIWTENAQGTGAVNFITGMGGFLQAVVMGYGGVRLQRDALLVDFTLPRDTQVLSLKGLNYLGNSLDISGNTTMITVELTGMTEKAVVLDMVVSEYEFKLVIGQPVQLRIQPFRIKPRTFSKLTRSHTKSTRH